MDSLNSIGELNESWRTLPIIHEGESKIIRRLTDDLYVISLKPTLFSYTANRSAEVPGTDALRLRISRVLWGVLEKGGLELPIIDVFEDFYVTHRVDATPIEVIVKAAFYGTPKHIYLGMAGHPTRKASPFRNFDTHSPYVRFDWRNPLPGKDECLPEPLADYFIDTREATRTALTAFALLREFLDRCDIQLLDICFFIDSTGKYIFGEVSPDCMRAKLWGEDIDKDLWRKGRCADEILEKWEMFAQRVEIQENQ